MMKSPRKRRDARAAAHSTRRNAAPGRRQQIRHKPPEEPGILQSPKRATSTWGAQEGCRVSSRPLRTVSHNDATGHPKRADIQGSLGDLETHADLQCMGCALKQALTLGLTHQQTHHCFCSFAPWALKDHKTSNLIGTSTQWCSSSVLQIQKQVKS